MSRGAFRSARRGIAAVVAVVVLVMLQLVTGVLLTGGSREIEQRSLSVDGLRSFYAAEGAANMAVRELMLESDEDGDGTVGGVSSGGGSANDPRLGPARMASTGVSASGATTTVTVEGAAGSAVRRQTVTVVRSAGGSAEARGLVAEAFHAGGGLSSLAGVSWSAPWAVGVVPDVQFGSASSNQSRWIGGQNNNFAMRFRGRINVPATGTWTFYTNSDDGSDLSINGTRVVNNDGLHGMQTRSGAVHLAAGMHDFEVRWFERSGNNGCIASWSGPGVATATVIPPSAFTCEPPPLPSVLGHARAGLTGDGSGQGAVFDGYDSGSGPHGSGGAASSGAVLATNSTGAGALTLSNAARLLGDASAGFGGDPASVIVVGSGSTVSGQRGALGQRALLLRQSAPSGLSSSGTLVVSSSATWNTARRYTSVSVSGWNTVVTVTGDVTMVVDADFTIRDGARIVLAPGATLRLFIGGGLSASGSAVVNDDRPSDAVQVAMTGTNRTATVTDSARVFARLFNPGGSLRVALSGEFGGWAWCNTVDVVDRGRLRGDVAGAGGSGGSPTVSVSGWSEIP